MTTFDTSSSTNTDTTRFADSAKAYGLGAKPDAERPTERLGVPLRGANNPGSGPATTPGSFANPENVGGALTFSSPDTPNMPQASPYTAWDFLPEGWTIEAVDSHADGCGGHNQKHGPFIRCVAPHHEGKPFEPITQLESARMGIVTDQMKRVAEREGHLTPEQVRDEVAAGRCVIPANLTHLKYNLDPMAIGRATKTKINANMGASPVSSGTEEEVEKLKWAEQWGGDTVMDLSTGGDL
ncbi:MAG: phosphomethylpyrimidine synthase ThiC, partial [Planctomycetota bacterium]